MTNDSINRPVSRRTLAVGIAWATPAIALAAAAPAFAVSPCIDEPLRLLYADFGTPYPNGFLSFTSGESDVTCMKINGVQYARSFNKITITNNSKYTISDLQAIYPFEGARSSSIFADDCYHPSEYKGSGHWVNSNLTSILDNSPGGPDGYNSYWKTYNGGNYATDSAPKLVSVDNYTGFFPTSPPGGSWNHGLQWCSSTGPKIATGSQIPIYYPQTTTLAPRAATTFYTVNWRETGSALLCNNYGYVYGPDFIFGRVCGYPGK